MKLKTLLLPPAGDARITLALLILRLFVGVAFIQHGNGKLMHPAEFAARALPAGRRQCHGSKTRKLNGSKLSGDEHDSNPPQ